MELWSEKTFAQSTCLKKFGIALNLEIYLGALMADSPPPTPLQRTEVTHQSHKLCEAQEATPKRRNRNPLALHCPLFFGLHVFLVMAVMYTV